MTAPWTPPMTVTVNRSEVVAWARSYKGEKFHALLCDPPYHLTSIVERFGKEGSAPAQYGRDGAFARASAGFMGQEWDGGDIAFQPDTWAALGEHLYPGVFGMAYASSRGYHRLAVAIEDAGFVLHPSIFLWLQSQGFPKATRIDHKLEGQQAEIWQGHRYGLQALKPVVEPIIVFQKPYDGRPLDNIVDTGAGALNIDAARIGTEQTITHNTAFMQFSGQNTRPWQDEHKKYDTKNPPGRWPANFALVHHPECKLVGYTDGKFTINRFKDGAKPWGDGAGHEYESSDVATKEQVWDCHPDCPCKKLGENSRYYYQGDWRLELYEADQVGYYPKANRKERDAGLIDKDKQFLATMGDGIGGREHNESEPGAWARNPHPTVKPMALSEWLATLLLPPAEYMPRRLLNPFAGSGSEAIGAMRAGWEYVLGIEKSDEYCDIARARIEYWRGEGKQLTLF